MQNCEHTNCSCATHANRRPARNSATRYAATGAGQRATATPTASCWRLTFVRVRFDEAFLRLRLLPAPHRALVLPLQGLHRSLVGLPWTLRLCVLRRVIALGDLAHFWSREASSTAVLMLPASTPATLSVLPSASALANSSSFPSYAPPPSFMSATPSPSPS